MDEKSAVFDAHDTGIRYHFSDTDMDFNFGTFMRRRRWENSPGEALLH